MMQDNYDRNLGTQKSRRNLRSGKSGPRPITTVIAEFKLEAWQILADSDNYVI